MEQLWRNIDAAVLSPRMDTSSPSLPRIRASGDALELDGRADPTVEALVSDLKTLFTLVARKLPRGDLMDSLCRFMMVDLIPRLVRDWLTPAVPTSLDRIPDFDRMIEEAGALCRLLEEQGYTHYDELQLWVDNAPNIWLGKCTETALDSVRASLSRGIGQSRQVEKVEKHMVSVAEGKELATSGAGATAETNEWGDDWGDAWDVEEPEEPTAQETQTSKPEAKGKFKVEEPPVAEDDGADAWGWDDEDAGSSPVETKQKPAAVAAADEDDSADAWGWGDEDVEVQPEPKPLAKDTEKLAPKGAPKEATRELVLKETYHISSMPEPLLELITAILEDGAKLVKDGHRFGHVAATANGLFVLPNYVLALFRAISPHYYAVDGGGNMYDNPSPQHTNVTGANIATGSSTTTLCIWPSSSPPLAPHGSSAPT